MCDREYINWDQGGTRPGATQEEQIAFLRRWLATFESGERVITCIEMSVPEVRTGAPGSGPGEFTAAGYQMWSIISEPKSGTLVFANA